jgi:hypothetical protein
MPLSDFSFPWSQALPPLALFLFMANQTLDVMHPTGWFQADGKDFH